VPSTSGGVAQRWGLLDSEPRQPPAPRPVDKPWRQPSDQAGKACKPLCRPALAGAAAAQPARTSLAAGLQTTFLHDSTVCPTPHAGQRGRPGPGAQPDQIVDPIGGALASRLTDRRARVDQQRCCSLATHAWDEAQLSAPAVLDGYQGQAAAERGLRFLKAPPFVASSRSLTKPARVMALWMVMTVCVLVYAA
jgi:hypothetical protein